MYLKRLTVALCACACLCSCGGAQPDDWRGGIRPGDMVLGDSLALMGDWGPGVINEGVGGETVSEIRARVPGIIAKYEPCRVYIMAATNDVLQGVDVVDTYWEYVGMVGDLRRAGFAVMVISTCRIANIDVWANYINGVITELNTLLAAELGAFTDVNGALCTGGYLSADYDWGDGVHLNEEGYKCIITTLQRCGGRYCASQY